MQPRGPTSEPSPVVRARAREGFGAPVRARDSYATRFRENMERHMGGIGSGRHRYGSPRTCERCVRVDLAWLRRRGLLIPGVSRAVQWAWMGQVGGTLQIAASDSGVALGGEFARYTYSATRFGGRRQWLSCPGCGRGCRVLYRIGSFRCRRCHYLTYNSQHASALVRALDRDDRIRRQIGERLGQEFEGEHDFPGKPKRMRWATYRSLRNRYFEIDNFAAVMSAAR